MSDDVVQWTECDGVWTAQAYGCGLIIRRVPALAWVTPDPGPAWEWRAMLGHMTSAVSGRVNIDDYGDAYEPGKTRDEIALEAAQECAVDAACDLAERSGLAAVVRERDALRAGIRAVLDDLPEELYGIEAKLRGLLPDALRERPRNPDACATCGEPGHRPMCPDAQREGGDGRG